VVGRPQEHDGREPDPSYEGWNGRRLVRKGRVPRNITIRMVEADLDFARKQAEKMGLPYQTYIKSLRQVALAKRARRPG
jgi:hypothetical protein